MKSINIIFIIILSVSCKQNKVALNTDSNSYNRKQFLNKEYIEIVIQDNEFKLSYADPENYNRIKLTDKILRLELIEPMDYEISKIVPYKGGYKIFLVNEDFYFLVNMIIPNLGISHWQNIDEDIVNEELSFYAIESKKLKKAKLSIEDCNSKEPGTYSESTLNENTF